MRPRLWQPPVELSEEEAALAGRVRRGTLFVFVRRWRHVLFAPEFQAELGALLYAERPKGRPPVPPAVLALATLLQAYTRVSDDEVIEATVMDRRWQLALGCLGATRAPFSKATLVAFRRRLIATEGDRRLVERTLEVARGSGGFDARALRAALDSSPLWGAGRVEDTLNLLGHALRQALGAAARQQGRGLAAVAAEAGAALVGGPASLKAALDLDWDDPDARERGLATVLGALEAATGWLTGRAEAADPDVRGALATAAQVRAQDVVEAPDVATPPTLRRGVARDRRISVEDPQMRHGRKSRAVRVDGYKRHLLQDLDSGLILAAGLAPANAPEAQVVDALEADLAAQGLRLEDLAELHVDRAYLASRWVRQRPPALALYAKPWPVPAGPRFPKTAFAADWDRGVLRCPAGVERPAAPGRTARFPAATCAACPQRARCTTSARGRSVHLHPDERLLEELRQRQRTPTGRARLRERVAVEHALAHVGFWQGERARYRGPRKNLFDLRRCAAVDNLFILSHLPAFDPQAA